MENNNSQKKFRIAFIVISVIILALLLMPVIRTACASHSGLLLDTQGNYSMIQNIHLCGETLICRKSSFSSQQRNAALSDETGKFSLSIISLRTIKSIEFIQPLDEETGESAEKNILLGRFKINVQGHEGTLVLYEEEGKIHGTVRFPGWANGATEYLKNVKISDNRISFTRSATTLKEMRRLGANNLFTQNFSGNYSKSGKRIWGQFINDRREKYQWEAVK